MNPQEAIKERLERTEEVRFALLYGSRAQGRPRADSDWDVGVFLSGDLSAPERFEVRSRLLADLADLGPVDVLVLNDAPPLLAQRALEGFRLVVKDRSAYVRFFTRVLAEAGDERFWRGLHRQARARRLQEGRFGRP